MRALLALILALPASSSLAVAGRVRSAPAGATVVSVPGFDFSSRTGDSPGWHGEAAAGISAPWTPDTHPAQAAEASEAASALRLPDPWAGLYRPPAADEPVAAQGGPFDEARRAGAAPAAEDSRPGPPSETGRLESLGKSLSEYPGDRPAALSAFWDAARFQGQMRNDLDVFGPLQRQDSVGAGEILERVQEESRISFLIEKITFAIDPALLGLMDKETLRRWLQRAIEEGGVVRGGAFSAELKSLDGRAIALALLDRSGHLMEYHARTGAAEAPESLVGINRGLFEGISSQGARGAIFAMGLTHELRHAAGKDKSPSSEKELSEQDAAMFRRLIPEQDKERTLSELSALLEADSLFLFELNKSKSIHVHGDYPRGIFAAEFNPKSRQVVTGGWDGKVHVWDTHEGGVISERGVGAGANILALGFEHAGSRIAVGGDEGDVRILDERNSTHLTGLAGARDEVTTVSFSRDDRLVAAGTQSGLVRVWNTADSSLAGELRHPHSVRSLAFSPDGRDLATVDAGGVVRRHSDFDSFKVVKLGRLEREEKAAIAKVMEKNRRYGVAFSPDSRLLAASGPGGHLVRVWDTVSGGMKLKLKTTGQSNWFVRLTFSGDGRLLAGADEGGWVYVWEMPSGRALFRHQFEDSVLGLRFELDTHLLVVFDRDGNLTEVLIR